MVADCGRAAAALAVAVDRAHACAAACAVRAAMTVAAAVAGGAAAGSVADGRDVDILKLTDKAVGYAEATTVGLLHSVTYGSGAAHLVAAVVPAMLLALER